jgi:hypothetical protein
MNKVQALVDGRGMYSSLASETTESSFRNRSPLRANWYTERLPGTEGSGLKLVTFESSELDSSSTRSLDRSTQEIDQLKVLLDLAVAALFVTAESHAVGFFPIGGPFARGQILPQAPTTPLAHR